MIVFGISPYTTPIVRDNKLESALYGGFHRFAWAVCVSWIIFACIKGYAGFINTLLSFKFFNPLAKLGYSVYLSSLHIQFLLHYSFRTPMYYTPYSFINVFFAHILMSYFAGAILYLTVEAPFLEVVKLIFPTPKPVPSLNAFPQPDYRTNQP